MYQRALEYLPRFQIEAAASFDFSKCLPPNDFFSHTLVHDMQAFSTELVGRILPNTSTEELKRDFASLIEFLSKAERGYFVYRDFQSRNIMVLNDELFFIDFQSGLRGPLQYDVASLLYQSSAQIPDEARAELVDLYISAAQRYTRCDREEFHKFFAGFVVTRMVQVLGVYGRQGLGAKKDYFAKSIPRALETLHSQLTSERVPLKLDGLKECSQALLKALT
jgi:aminoglycoside/choline kinase family phosphotransferase